MQIFLVEETVGAAYGEWTSMILSAFSTREKAAAFIEGLEAHKSSILNSVSPFGDKAEDDMTDEEHDTYLHWHNTVSEVQMDDARYRILEFELDLDGPAQNVVIGSDGLGCL